MKKSATRKSTKKVGTSDAAGTKRAVPKMPASPESRPVETRQRAPKPEKDLRRAENTLGRAIETYRRQTGHPGNGEMNFVPFYNRLKELEDVYAEKGFSKKSRDLTYDWDGFCKEVIQAEKDLLQGVIDFFIDKATRMVENPATRLTQEEVDEIWEEADELEHLPGKIFGWSNAVRKLKARGLYDPQEQKGQGGRQTGGNRRRR